MERAPVGNVVVVCGKGNNGGDGLVVARLLRAQGRDVSVLLTGEPDEFRGDARTNLERLARAGAGAVLGRRARASGGDRRRDPRHRVLGRAAGRGRDRDRRDQRGSGRDRVCLRRAQRGRCVHRRGLRRGRDRGRHRDVSRGQAGVVDRSRQSARGDVTVVNIGIPDGGPSDPSIGLIDEAVSDGIPRRGRESTKFAAGSVLVCGGSIGLTGAPSMASEAAMRAGAGYVTACVPASLNLIFETRLLEAMTVPVADRDGRFDADGAGQVLERTERVDSLVLGPGLGREPETQSFAREVARAARVPLLLDADGLNAHAGALETLARRQAPTVLTPHAGELARLLETDSASIDAHRLDRVRRAATTAGAIVLLKGDDTLVAAPDGRVGVSRGGAPGARHRRNRRRPLGRDRGAAVEEDGPLRGGVRRGVRSRRRREAGRRRTSGRRA